VGKILRGQFALKTMKRLCQKGKKIRDKIELENNKPSIWNGKAIYPIALLRMG